jgi:hypothetical protein
VQKVLEVETTRLPKEALSADLASQSQFLAAELCSHGHTDGEDRMRGSSIRIVFANVSPDDRLRADIPTYVFSEEDTPVLQCGGRS